ncbi:MAG TPA: hypothetical protein VJ901_17815 [Thermoanaerobaculia bacterium]|nr:hypothetical protein [Thermoanaerobaculia bacterium]
MSEKHTKENDPFISDAEFLEGLHRTREELHTFDAIDLDAVTRQGVDEYWRERELLARSEAIAGEPAEIAEADLSTARLARTVAPRLGESISGTWRTVLGISATALAAGSIYIGWNKIRRAVTQSLRASKRALVK